MKITELIKKVRKSVVRIHAIYADGEESHGSGFIVDKKGMILTNHHVVIKTHAVVVVFYDGRIDIGRVIFSDPYRDIAFIIVKSRNLRPVKLNFGRYIQAGEEIITIGHPADLPYSVSKGIISYPRRIREQEPNLVHIQYDASSHPGSSGGPLLDLRGTVIGIVTETGMPSRETLNLAVPIYTVKPSMERMMRMLDGRGGKYCHICGETNNFAERYCNKCGSKLLTESQFDDIQRHTKALLKNRVVCRHCNNIDLIDEQTRTCHACGKSLIADNKKQSLAPKARRVICSVCKKLNQADEQYCVNCGVSLRRSRRDGDAQT